MSSLSQIRILNITEDLGVGTDQVATVDQLSSVGNTIGAQAFVEETNRLYIWNGQGWYNIALINTTPTWDTSPLGAYELDNTSSGVATTISLEATDPEGIPITYSHIIGGSMDSMATISQDSSVFTITPKTEAQLDSQAGPHTGTITFRATDGVNILPYVSSFTLTFTAPSPEWDTYTQTGDTVYDGSNFRAQKGRSVVISADGKYAVISSGYSNGYTTYFQIWEDTTGNGNWVYRNGNNYGSSFHYGVDISIDDDGETVVVGAPGFPLMHIWKRSGSTWSQAQTISGNRQHGFSVALSGDGLHLATADPEYSSNKGRLIFYSRADKSTDFSQDVGMDTIDQHTQTSSWLGRGWSGTDVNYRGTMEMNKDGTRLVVGCPSYQGYALGRAYLITRPDTSTAWSGASGNVKYFQISGSDKCGGDVAISGDGNTMVVNNPYTATNGEIYIIDISTLPSGASLTYDQRIRWNDLTNSEKGTWTNSYWFGQVVDVNNDGKTIITSARTYQSSYLTSMGTVYIFRKNTTSGNWEWKDKIEPSPTSSQDNFGSDVAISADGYHLMVGECEADDGTTENGAFHVYKATS